MAQRLRVISTAPGEGANTSEHSRTLQIEVGFSAVLSLPEKTRSLIVGNPELIGIEPFGQQPGTKYIINAKKQGFTNVLPFTQLHTLGLRHSVGGLVAWTR
jgi:Flp pilus assembly secretin CpaC